MIAEGVGVVRDPLEGTYSTLRVVLRGLTFTTGIDRQRARRGAEPLIVVVILVVSEGQLRGQRLTILLIQEQRQEVELHGTVPVEELRRTRALVLLEELKRVIASSLPLEVVVERRILGIHNRRRGVSLDSIAEDVPRSILAVGDTGSDIQREGDEPTLRRMVQCDTRTIFLTTRIEIDTIGAAVVSRHTIVRASTTTAEAEGVLGTCPDTAHRIEPVDTAPEVVADARGQAVRTILISTEHIELALDDVEGDRTRVGRVEVAVTGALLSRHEDDPIGSARTIDSTGSPVLEDVEALDIVGVEVRQITTRHPVDDDEWAKACSTGGDPTHLDACLIVGVP